MAFTILADTQIHYHHCFSSLQKYRIMGKFCFSFKGGEPRGSVQSSRRAPTGNRVRK